MMRGVVLVVALAALVVAGPAAAAPKRCSLAQLEDQVMCPTCEGQTIGQSSAPAAGRVKAFIQRRSEAGDTCSEIEAKLVGQFGEGVLASPPKRGFGLLAWVLPLVGLGVGAIVVAALAWRWSRGREAAAIAGVPDRRGRGTIDPELERRLDEELARFD
jgi:cytochrome c-type biogenesis protein CcmH